MRIFTWLMAGALLVLASTSHAGVGDLDPSFGTGGKVTTDFGPASDRAFAVAIQTDGKIVAAGDSGSGDFALVRYNTDGSLDLSFGSGGKVTTDFGGFGDSAFALAVQSDGKIIAAGAGAPGGLCCQFALARYQTDGSLDTSFHGDGRVLTPFGGNAQVAAIAVQSDGKIVAAGSMATFDSLFALVRYNVDGSLDLTFGSGGKVTTDFGGFDAATGVAVQADGKIVAVGGGGSSNDFLLARYNVDGSLDASFGTGGKVVTDFGGFDGAEAVAIQPDSKIVAVGRGGVLTRFALARYNTNGSLDTGFSGDGKVTTLFFGENIESAAAVAIQDSGKIVVVGRVFQTFDPSFALARYRANGDLDPTFGSGGKVTTDFGNPADVGVLCPSGRKDCSEDDGQAIAIQSDGKIVAVGGAGPCVPSCQFALARYLGGDAGQVVASLSPATVWVGLKNSDDIGTQFDVRAEVWKNAAPVAVGEARCITGVTRNANLAKMVNIPFGEVAENDLIAGDVLSLRILTRIGTTLAGQKCSGPGGSHGSARGLRLYYDSTGRPSQFGAELTPDPLETFFLHSNSDDYFDTIAPDASAPKFKDSPSVDFSGGNPWREIDTWSQTLP